MSTQDTTSNEQKPSVEAFKRYEPDDLAAAIAMLRRYSISAPLVAGRIAEMVYDERRRVRREARAEAFEEAAKVCAEREAAYCVPPTSPSDGPRIWELRECASEFHNLAAKERAS